MISTQPTRHIKLRKPKKSCKPLNPKPLGKPSKLLDRSPLKDSISKICEFRNIGIKVKTMGGFQDLYHMTGYSFPETTATGNLGASIISIRFRAMF